MNRINRIVGRDTDSSQPPAPLRDALRPSRRALLTAAAFSFFANLILLASPLYMMQLYNRVLPARSEATLLVLTGLVGALLVALATLDAVRACVMVRVSGRLERALGGRVLEAVFRAAPERCGREGQQALRDFDALRQFCSGTTAVALFDAPWAPLFVAVVFAFHPLLGTVALGGSLGLIGLAVLNDLTTRGRLEEAKRLAVGAGGFVESSLRNLEALEAMGMFPHLQRRWLARRNAVMRLQSAAADRTGTFAAVSRAARLLLQAALLAAGAHLAIHDAVTPGVIVAASVLMSRGLAPIEQAIGGWRQLVEARVAYNRLNALLAQASPRPPRTSLPRPRGELRVENLVAWPPDRPAPTLRGISFVLPAGEVLAVLGPSGSGKSTLVRQIVGVWRPHAGKVRLDGADVHAWNREELGPHVGYLPQDVELFDGTVAENIARLGDLDSRKIVDAAERAGVHEMILRLPHAYETPVGPGGCVLSGGQRQRIGLARALYGDPALIVLDEPNSNLDQAGEAALAAAIAGLRRVGRTVVLVSHRPKILREADHILLLDDGRVQLFRPQHELRAELARPAQFGPGARPAAVSAAR